MMIKDVIIWVRSGSYPYDHIFKRWLLTSQSCKIMLLLLHSNHTLVR